VKMRELYKNPMLYYVLIPVLVGLWPLLVWAVYLPQAENNRDLEAGLCVDGISLVTEILNIDPDRPNKTGPAQTPVEFSYVSAMGQVANLCKIPSSGWTSSAGGFQESGGKRRQDAQVKLLNVGVVQIAQFLHTAESLWVHLSCETLKLQKKKGMPDQWDADFRFLYYY